MSRQKLTIVVTCTDRKVVAAQPALTARTLSEGTVQARVREWRRRLSREQATMRLADLYSGESWTQVKRLIATARSTGYAPDVFVASAGVGLRRIDELSPPYAATFSVGHADSVAPTVDEARTWWSRLPHTPVPEALHPSIWVLSEAYSRVLAHTLPSIEPRAAAVVFGGSSNVPDEVRVPADRGLRRALGGTVMSLNVRMAIRWLEIAEGQALAGARTRLAWEEWSRRERHEERYDRKPLTDDAVREFIANLAKLEPGVSKTRALGTLRKSGMACEQRRFATLFSEVVKR
jgi:hypothetical protein